MLDLHARIVLVFAMETNDIMEPWRSCLNKLL
jgi:hypothetical protein